ncbi:MAG: hypothetical protein KFW21_01085 [Spirochaetota bacterium]|nr:hypothetical protein [Spirochaetota bacterium]
MKKILFLMLSVISFVSINFAQTTTTEGTITSRPNNSTIDQGFYWDNSFRGRWNAFGACYRTKLYYRGALLRGQNSFWFANSSFEVGLEQAIASYSRTSLFLFWQPVIAVNFLVKIGYSKDFTKPALLTGSGDNYNHALPPFTGLNPLNRKPVYLDTDTLEIEFSPTFTFGGPAGPGMIALIYNPTLIYIHNFGMNPNQYYLNNRESIVLKAQDIFWNHDIKLGYNITGTGMSVALTSIIQHVQSVKGIFRAGVFGSFSYEKASIKYPNIVPYFRGQVGTWVKDRYMTQYFAIQVDTGVKFKF